MLKKRTIFLRVAVGAVLLGLSGRLAWVQVVKADQITRMSEQLRLTTKTQEPIRGPIVDRTGKPLAISVGQYTVVAAPKLMKPEEMQEAALKLADPLGLKAEEILAELMANPESWWVPLKKGLSWDEGLKIRSLNLLGINLQQEQKRTYPQGMLANHILGYTSPTDGNGEYGLEAFYEEQLKGEPGFVISEFTEKETPIIDTIKQEVPPVQGKKLVLTIDAALQQYVENELDAIMKDPKRAPKRALVIAMDVKTGEILTMAMRPAAHPGDRKTWGDPVDWNRLKNWALDPIPVGSIFKTITSSAALEERAITTSTLIADEGAIKRDGWTISNWDLMVPPKPLMNIHELLQRSSNVGLVKVGEAVGPEKFQKYLRAFGFMEKTGIDLTGENGAFGLENFGEKKAIDWANIYIGQHSMYTPIQMVRAVAAIANGGYLVTPHLVKEIQDAQGNVTWTPKVETKRSVISQQTAKEVQEAMVSVIENAYQQAKPPGYTAGGKTGTAQKFDDRGKIMDFMVADFIGFAPANNPEVVMLVMLDEPPPPGYGGQFAAPVFAKLMPEVMRIKGIAPNTEAAKGEEKAPPKVEEGIVPDVQWLPKEYAEKRLREWGFTPKWKGAGAVVSAQSLKPGSAAKAGAEVELTLVPKDEKLVAVPDFSRLSLSEASHLAEAVGLALKAEPHGVGFVVSQDPAVGAKVPKGSSFTVRLAPRP